MVSRLIFCSVLNLSLLSTRLDTTVRIKLTAVVMVNRDYLANRYPNAYRLLLSHIFPLQQAVYPFARYPSECSLPFETG